MGDMGNLRAALAELDPDALAAPAEAPLLAEALARVRAALGDPAVTGAALALRGLRPGDAGWIIARHAELYGAEEGFDGSFEPLVAQILTGFLERHDPARERAWVAERGGVRLGTIFCVAGEAPGSAKLRLFWLEPSARGQGIAPRMLDTCLDFARAAGYAKIGLWTHESHVAAGRLYAGRGFGLVRAAPVTSFGQPLVEQHWELAL